MKAEIQNIWTSYSRMEVALIGHDGNNGIRGTMQEHYRTTNDRLDDIDALVRSQSINLTDLTTQLQRMTTTFQTIGKSLSWLIAITGSVGIIVGIVSALQ